MLWNKDGDGSEVFWAASDDALEALCEGFDEDIGYGALANLAGTFPLHMPGPKAMSNFRVGACP